MTSRPRLLFDENLSPRLPRIVSQHFPDSVHVNDVGLSSQPDDIIWEYARDNYLIVTTKNRKDFVKLYRERGTPPKIIALQQKEYPYTEMIAQAIINKYNEIIDFFYNSNEGIYDMPSDAHIEGEQSYDR